MQVEKYAKAGMGSCLLLIGVFLAGCGGSGGGGTSAPVTSSSSEPPAPSQWLQSQARPIAHADQANDDYADLQPLGDAIGDARVVGLAEVDHGSGDMMSMKSRLIKYLHEQKGFDVLDIESSQFTMHRIWQLAQQGQSVDSLAPNAIFFPTAMTAEGRAILQYVDAQRTTASPLILTGNSGAGVAASKIDDSDMWAMLNAVLKARGSKLPASSDWAAFSDMMQNYWLSGDFTRIGQLPAAEQPAASRMAEALAAELCAAQAALPETGSLTDSPAMWCSIGNDIRSSLQYQISGDVSVFEKAAAVNFITLDKALYSGHKIIITQHIQHLGKDTQWYQTGLGVNEGGELKRAYGKEMYTIAFTASGGIESAWWDYPTVLDNYTIGPDDPTSIEVFLAPQSSPYVFVDAAHNPPPAGITALKSKVSNFDYVDPTDNALLSIGVAYDGLIYMHASTGLTWNR